MQYAIRYVGAPHPIGSAGHDVLVTDSALEAKEQWLGYGALIRRDYRLIAIDAVGVERPTAIDPGGTLRVDRGGDMAEYEPDFRVAT